MVTHDLRIFHIQGKMRRKPFFFFWCFSFTPMFSENQKTLKTSALLRNAHTQGDFPNWNLLIFQHCVFSAVMGQTKIMLDGRISGDGVSLSGWMVLLSSKGRCRWFTIIMLLVWPITWFSFSALNVVATWKHKVYAVLCLSRLRLLIFLCMEIWRHWHIWHD